MDKKQITIKLSTIIYWFAILMLIYFVVLYILQYNARQAEEAEKENIVKTENVAKVEENKVENKTNVNNIDIATNEDATSQEEQIRQKFTRELNKNELDLLEVYLESPGIWNFIYFEYKDLSEFNLRDFLRYYYNRNEATDEMVKNITGQEDYPVPIHLYAKTYIDDIFKKYTGEDVSIIKNQDHLPLYSEMYKSYYNSTSDADYLDIDVKSGTEFDDTYTIRYTLDSVFLNNKEYELVLRKNRSGTYLFVSNIAVK